MKSHHLSLSLTVLACLLASCSGTRPCGDSHPYRANRPIPPLQAPAGVTLPKPDPAYLVPGASTKVPATTAPAAGTAAAPCYVVPPSVLTKEDMTRSAKPAPAKPAPAATTKVPAASTVAKPPASPAPTASTQPNLAAGGPLE